MPAALFTLSLTEGHGWMRGPPCPGCHHGQDDAVTGVVVDLPAKGHMLYTCWRCGADIDARVGYMTPQTGNITIHPEANGDLSKNPYLFPQENHFGDDALDPESDPNDPMSVWFEFGLNDIGNAQRLHMLHGDWFRYVHEWGWMVYDGRRWILDTIGAMQHFAKHVVKTMLRACGERIDITTDFGKQWLKHAQKSASKGQIAAMIELARSEPGVSRLVSDFDANPDILNVRNGVLDTRTGQLRQHRPEDYCTRLVDINYDPLAECSRWDQFLEEITCGDQELMEFLQVAAGYSQTGSTKEQKLFFLFGDGANGKSTFLEVLKDLMGDYSGTMPFEAFLRSKTKDSTRVLADLPGKRYVTAIEAGEGRHFDEEMVKSVTGQDTIRARYLYKEAFDFQPSAKIWLAANDKPAINGDNVGIWRRFIVVPLQADIPESMRDANLREHLQEELPGILAWAIRGAMTWHNTGLPMPRLIREALEAYREENNFLERFFEECCEIDPKNVTAMSTIVEAYQIWAKKNGERPMNARSLGARLGKYRAGLLRPCKSFGQRGWEGISVLPSALGERDDPQRRI